MKSKDQILYVITCAIFMIAGVFMGETKNDYLLDEYEDYIGELHQHLYKHGLALNPEGYGDNDER